MDERIERFLRGEMSVDEEKQFRADLNSNPQLKEEAALMARTLKAMRVKARERDKEVIQSVSTTQHAKIIPLRLKALRIAVSIVVLFVLGGGGIHLYDASRMNSMFEENYPVNMMGVSRGSQMQSVEKDLATIYKNINTEKDMKPIIGKLKSMYEGIDTNGDYYAYANEIKWYLSLALIKDHQAAEAQKMLREIYRDNHDNELGRKADSLCNELNSIILK